MDPRESGTEFGKVFLDACHDLAARKAAEELILHPNLALSEKSLIERYQQEIWEKISTCKRRQKIGASKMSESLNELAMSQPDLFTPAVLEGIERISSLSTRVAFDNKVFSEHILKGGTLQEFASADDTILNCLYLGAKRLYDKELLEEAADAFLFLTGLNPEAPSLWFGLANAEFYRENYTEALAAYTKAVEKNPYDLSFYIALSQCYEEMGEKDKALNAIDTALATIQDIPEYAEFRQGLEEEKFRLER